MQEAFTRGAQGCGWHVGMEEWGSLAGMQQTQILLILLMFFWGTTQAQVWSGGVQAWCDHGAQSWGALGLVE